MNYDRFHKAMRWSRKAMEPFRVKRQGVIKSMYGAHWKDGAMGVAQPVNMLELTVRIWLRNLVAKAPTVTVTPKDRKWKPLAKDFELVMRQVVGEIELSHALEDAAFDALTCPIGTVKVGITDATLGEARGWSHDAGLPFADAVDFDDLVLDMAAGRLEAMCYVGDRYSLPYETAMDSKLFKAKGEKIEPQRYPHVNDEFGNRKVVELATDGAGDYDMRDSEEMLELWDVWKPRDRVVCTFRTGGDGLPTGDPIRTVEWEGPEQGPYYHLTYGKGKGILRMPPVAALKDLHDTINRNFRKLDRQSARQKTILAVQAGQTEDGSRVTQSADGQTVVVDRTDSVKEMRFGGADQGNLAFSEQLRVIFSYMAGNLDAQGGLSQTAGTLGQEELIRESASQTIEDMRTTTVQFAKRVVNAVAAWVWYDPVRTYVVEKPLGDSGITLPVDVRPKDREESAFLEMALDIMPSSMVDTSNGMKLRVVMNTLQQVTMQLAPVLPAAGLQLDVQGIHNTIAELTDVPEVADFVRPLPNPAMDAAAGGGQGVDQPFGGGKNGDEMRKPASTRREYVRRNVATGGTQGARANVLMQRAMGGNVTPQQDAMMGRT